MSRKLAIGTLLINLVVFALAGLSIYQSRLQYQARAEVTTQNLSRVLEENINGILDKVDLALLSVQDEVARQIAAGGIDARALNAFLAQQQAHQPEILSLRATDAEGVVRYGLGVPPLGGPKNSDREYFIRARDESRPGLIVTKPMFARIDKKWVVVIARRLSKPDGTFAGVVYVNVGLENLSKTFSELNVGRHGSVTLRGRDLGLVVRHPEPGNLGKAIGSAPSLDFQKLVQSGRGGGTFRSRNPLDDIERTLTYRKIADKPFYIIVGVATDDYLAVWRKDTAKTVALMALFFLVTLVSSRLIYRSWGRQIAAGETVREQKDFLDAILDSEPECVKVIGLNGALLQMNRAGLAMLEVESFDEAQKLGFLHFVLPEYRDAFLSLSQRIFSGESGTLEFPIEGKKGTRRWLDTHAMPLRNPTGEVSALVGVARDITERNRMEEALLQSEYRLHELFENMSSGVAVYQASSDGQDFFFTAVNRAAERIENLHRADLIGKNLVEVFPHVVEFGLLDVLRRVWKTGEAEHFPMSFYQDARIVGWRENYVYKLPGGEVVAIYDDVTQRKEAEQALKQLNENLEERVKAEVAKSTEQERLLIQQSRLAAMGEMIGNIAHQWRQPLNALGLVLAEIQDAYAYNELDKASLEKSVANGWRMIQKMSSTIDDFRDFFRPNKEKEVFSLGRAVEDAVRLMESSLKGHAIVVQVENGGEVQVNGYPNELSQVLLNIFANAKEAFLERKLEGGKIDISWGEEGEKAWVAVRDNAGGIPADVLPKIFAPYFTTKEKGTGIGLYMSKTIMEHMNGHIEAANVGDGAKFLVVCPLWKPAKATPPAIL